jgi:L-lysine exporter family protein LysE/ArgO
MIEVPLAVAVGLALGVVTGIPLGVVNIAVVETAVSRGARAGAGIGVGGAIADLIHASLAFGGIGRAIVARPSLTFAMHAVAGGVLCAYAVVLWRRPDPAVATGAPAPAQRGFARGVSTGLALTLPNPAALGAWIAVAAALAPPSMTAGLAAALGVGLGSAAWFVALAAVAARGTGTRALTRRALTRGVAVALGALGVAAIVRAIV